MVDGACGPIRCPLVGCAVMSHPTSTTRPVLCRAAAGSVGAGATGAEAEGARKRPEEETAPKRKGPVDNAAWFTSAWTVNGAAPTRKIDGGDPADRCWHNYPDRMILPSSAWPPLSSLDGVAPTMRATRAVSPAGIVPTLGITLCVASGRVRDGAVPGVLALWTVRAPTTRSRFLVLSPSRPWVRPARCIPRPAESARRSSSPLAQAELAAEAPAERGHRRTRSAQVGGVSEREVCHCPQRD